MRRTDDTNNKIIKSSSSLSSLGFFYFVHTKHVRNELFVRWMEQNKHHNDDPALSERKSIRNKKRRCRQQYQTNVDRYIFRSCCWYEWRLWAIIVMLFCTRCNRHNLRYQFSWRLPEPLCVHSQDLFLQHVEVNSWLISIYDWLAHLLQLIPSVSNIGIDFSLFGVFELYMRLRRIEMCSLLGRGFVCISLACGRIPCWMTNKLKRAFRVVVWPEIMWAKSNVVTHTHTHNVLINALARALQFVTTNFTQPDTANRIAINKKKNISYMKWHRPTVDKSEGEKRVVHEFLFFTDDVDQSHIGDCITKNKAILSQHRIDGGKQSVSWRSARFRPRRKAFVVRYGRLGYL